MRKFPAERRLVTSFFGDSGDTTSTVTLNLNGFSETINGLSVGTGATASLMTVTNNNATNDSVLTVGDNNATSTYAGALNDGTTRKLGLTKIGSGALTLTGANTMSGTTTINAGTLILSAATNNLPNSPVNVTSTGKFDVTGVTGGYTLGNNKSLTNSGTVFGNVTVGTADVNNTGVITGNVTLSGGTARLSGSYSTNTVTVNSGGTLNPGIGISSVGVGTLVNNGAVLVEVSGASSDVLNVTNNANFTSGGLAFSLLGAPTHAFYDVATYGSLTGTPSILTPTVGRTSFTLDGSPPANTIRVDVTGGPASLTWDNSVGLGDGQTWDTQNSKNWNGVAAFGDPTQFYALDTVTFDDTNPNNNPNHYNVNVSGTVTPNNIIVNSTGSFTFNGGTIAGLGVLTKSGSARSRCPATTRSPAA